MAAGRRGSIHSGSGRNEALFNCPLSEKFDLIYGTSTGAIIAALLGLGKTVDVIEGLYRLRVVSVMGSPWPLRSPPLCTGHPD
jgi:patatin-like phospholipase/acyl hydrolase